MQSTETLDLTTQRLIGYQSTVTDTRVLSLLEAIKHGDEIPPVPVVKHKGIYYLTSIPEYRPFEEHGCLIGGHHRVIAFKMAEIPLPIVSAHKCYSMLNSDIPKRRFVPIEKIILEEDPGFREIAWCVGREDYRQIVKKRPLDFDKVIREIKNSVLASRILS